MLLFFCLSGCFHRSRAPRKPRRTSRLSAEPRAEPGAARRAPRDVGSDAPWSKRGGVKERGFQETSLRKFYRKSLFWVGVWPVSNATLAVGFCFFHCLKCEGGGGLQPREGRDQNTVTHRHKHTHNTYPCAFSGICGMRHNPFRVLGWVSLEDTASPCKMQKIHGVREKHFGRLIRGGDGGGLPFFACDQLSKQPTKYNFSFWPLGTGNKATTRSPNSALSHPFFWK